MVKRLWYWAVGPYCHRTFGQTPVFASLSQIQPTAVSSLQEVTAFFSPPAHDILFHAHLHRRKNTTEETGNKLRCHREGKFAFLFIYRDDESKTTDYVGPLVFSVTLTQF